MTIPGQPPRRNPYRDPSAYWPDGVPPLDADIRGAVARFGQVARPGEGPASSAAAPAAPARAGRTPRTRRPVSRGANVLGGMSLGAGLFALTLGLVPLIGAVLAAGPLVVAVLCGWGAIARARAKEARVPAMALLGIALSVLHVVLLFTS